MILLKIKILNKCKFEKVITLLENLNTKILNSNVNVNGNMKHFEFELWI